MGDVIFVAIVIAFFALAAGFVKVCDRIIGSDDASDLVLGQLDQVDEVAR